jgi:hypothetical protein
MRNTDPNGYWASAQARSVEGWRSRARVAESKLDAVERHIASLERSPDVREKDRAVVLRRVLLNASEGQ